MLHFSNQELAQTHHVSVRTVRNWIEAAKTGKLDLTLHEQGKRSYIANTSKNILTIEGLAEKGKKYRPHRAFKTVSPDPQFYELYSRQQIYDIVSSLEIYHEIPLQYSYFEGGATYWENYAQRLSEESSPNNLNIAIKLLANNRAYLDDILVAYDRVNIVDIGVGDAQPVKEMLQHLLNTKKLGRYIGIDISQKMLGIAEANVRKWFGNKVTFEGHVLNVEHERFNGLLAREYAKNTNGQRTSNVVFLLGGTIQSFRKPETILKVIHDSMGIDDFFLHSQKLDTPSTRRYFDFHVNPGNTALAGNHRLIIDLLHIDESLYDVEMGFDENKSERFIRVRLKVALTIKFDFQGGERCIDFNKDETILLWRARQNNLNQVLHQFIDSEFYPLQISQTHDHEYLLTISKIAREGSEP